MQNALKLDHCDGRVCVVELDGDLLREVFPVIVRPAKATDDVLERTGNEKILLEQAKLFSALGLVIRVKNFRNGFTVILFANGFLVTAAVEGLKVEFLRRPRFPEGCGDCWKRASRANLNFRLFRIRPLSPVTDFSSED